MARHSRRPRAERPEQRYVVQVIHRWLVLQMNSPSVR
jgi:hypothetical protein